MLRRPFNLYNALAPWQDIDKLQREMNRLFETTFSDTRRLSAPSFPAMNIWTNEDGAVVTAELPGVNPEDIDISVSGDSLTLSGSREPMVDMESVQYHRRERQYGKFTRTFQLPFAVEADKVEAMFEKGVLHIQLPRAEAEKPKKISVKTA